MRAWLIHIGEPLPIDGRVRLFRYGLLAEVLLARGAQVVQWAGSVNHFTKQQRSHTDALYRLSPDYSVQLMHGWRYRRHMGLRRLIYHRQVARSFERQAALAEPPDVIVASLPTLELAEVATRYAVCRGVPIVIDVRDLWPDVWVNAAPAALRGTARRLFANSFAVSRRCLSMASCVTAISDRYLQWGLTRGCRSIGPLDRVFAHGFAIPQLSAAEMTAADTYWDRKGVVARGRLRCCFFGGFNVTNHLEPWLIAVRRLYASGHTDIELVACGGGPKQRLYERLAQGCPSIRLFGWVDQPKLEALARRCDIGAVAYGRGAPQSMPNKPIEYMASRLAVLSTLTGGELEDLLRDTGSGATLADPSPEHIEQQLLRWKEQPELLSKLRNSAYATYCRHFEAGIIYRDMADHLEAVAGARMARPGFVRRAA